MSGTYVNSKSFKLLEDAGQLAKSKSLPKQLINRNMKYVYEIQIIS